MYYLQNLFDLYENWLHKNNERKNNCLFLRFLRKSSTFIWCLSNQLHHMSIHIIFHSPKYLSPLLQSEGQVPLIELICLYH